MANQRPPASDDLKADENLRRIDDLETFRKELEGKEFDKKVLQSLLDSHSIREELAKIVWNTIKNKITWIILAFIGVILTDLLIRAIPNILSAIH
jgi:hypothetical protein